MSDEREEVRAAGGVVWRVASGGDVEVLLVHRPGHGYDDWTFPKGKRDPTDASDEHCAIREVEEETGMRCVVGHELAGTSYLDRKGRSKTVRYWEMRVASGGFSPNAEVDEIRWVTPAEARQRLTYERDVAVLDSFLAFAGRRPELKLGG